MTPVEQKASDVDTRQQEKADPDMQRRKREVDRFRSSYQSLMNRTGFGSKSSTIETLRWLDSTELTDDTTNLKSIHWREDFISKDGSLVLQEGESLFSEFTTHMQRAQPYISKNSYNRWFNRLYDTSAKSASASSFKMKLQWVRSELGAYVARWQEAADLRDKIVANPKFKDAVEQEPDLAILNDRDRFLDKPYPERAGIVKRANALVSATNTNRVDLYSAAKSKLGAAASAGIMLDGKVGVWLDKIFNSQEDAKKIEKFVTGDGKHSLADLINNWRVVKERFDVVSKKASERGADVAARGFKMISATQFLSKPYDQRVSYVEEAEERLDDAKNVANEQPIFLKIRHAMDMKDWHEATALIEEAKVMHLKETDRPRLKSMERHVAQFSGKAMAESTPNSAEAQTRLDGLVQQLQQSHSEMVPLVTRLLKNPNANRNIHQLRWITYNNIWCRTHGGPYLDDEVARKGASTDQEQLTKHRAENGEDIGRNDSLGHSTSDSAYFRKQETAKHKATYLHTNMASGGVVSALGEKLERELDPRELYWTTLCPHLDGDPKPEAWMREFMTILTEMRSLTRVIEPKVSAADRVKGNTAAKVSYALSA